MHKVQSSVMPTCRVLGCPGSRGTHDVCNRHYDRAWRYFGAEKARKLLLEATPGALLDVLGAWKLPKGWVRLTGDELFGALQGEASARTTKVHSPDPAPRVDECESLRAEINRLGDVHERERAKLREDAETERARLMAVIGKKEEEYQCQLEFCQGEASALRSVLGTVRSERDAAREELEVLKLDERTAPRPLFVSRVDLDARLRPRIILTGSRSCPDAGVRDAAKFIGTWVRLLS